MTLEEAIINLQVLLTMADNGRWDTTDATEAVKVALTALRPVSREQVEKAWFREPYTRLETRSTPEGNRQYIAENTCMACGSKTPIGHFCHNCGVALDDWGVDMMLERWKEAVDGEQADRR